MRHNRLKDVNSNIATGDFQVPGSAAQFIGIARDTADIRGITMGFVHHRRRHVTSTVILEPASSLLAV
jgi:hypothetical protein